MASSKTEDSAEKKQKTKFLTILFGKVITPLSYYIKGDFRFKYFNEYKKNLYKTKREIQEFQLARLKALVKHAYDTVPYYKELFDKEGIKPENILTIGDFKKIPTLDKRTLLANTQKLISTKKYKLKKSYTGGSTGNKSVVYKDKRYLNISSGIWLRDLYSIGIEPGDKCAWVWFDQKIYKTLKDKILEFLILKVNRRIWFNVDKYSDEKIVKWLTNDFNRFKPDYIFGYPGTIYEMAKAARKNNIKLPPLKKIVVTAERLENRKFIEEVFKCPVIDDYGCSEVMTIAFEDNDKVMRSRDDFVFAELNDKNEVIVTPLESYGMPLLRYKPGDIGMISRSKSKKSTKSSSPFNEFNIVVGRTYEILYNKKGEKVGGGLIKQYVQDEDLDINEFQVVQKSLNDVELNIVKDRFTKEKSVARLVEILKENLGAKNVKINYLNTYPIEPNGKRIAFKCEVKR